MILRRNCKLAVVLHGFRERSASSEAFGPKIVSADHLPGTPMEPRSSIDDDLNSKAMADGEPATNLHPHHHHHHHNSHFLNGSSTKVVVKNEVSERRRSLDLINRPPSPSHFIQFTAAAATGNKKLPADSPLMQQRPENNSNQSSPPPPPPIDHAHHQFNHHLPHKDIGKPIHSSYSQDGLNNGIIEHSNGAGGGGRDKDDKEVSGDYYSLIMTWTMAV